MAICRCLSDFFSCSYLRLWWNDHQVHTFRNRLRRVKPSMIGFRVDVWRILRRTSMMSVIVCRRYVFVTMVYQVLFSTHHHVLGMNFNGRAWSMSLRWRRSQKSVGLLALRAIGLLGVASGYTSSILPLNQETCEGIIRVLQRLLAVIRLPTCALYLLHNITDIHQFFVTWYVDTTANTRTNRAASAQLPAACCCIHCHECKTRDHGTLYAMDNRVQVNRQSIWSYSNRRRIVACDRYRLTLFQACCGRQ